MPSEHVETFTEMVARKGINQGQAILLRELVEFIGENHEPCPNYLICEDYMIHSSVLLDHIHLVYGIKKDDLVKWSGAESE